MNAAVYALAAIGALVVTGCAVVAAVAVAGSVARRGVARRSKPTWTPADIYAAHQMGVDPRSLTEPKGA